MKIKKIMKRTVTIVLALAVALTLIVFGVNGYVILRSQRNILTLEKTKNLTDVVMMNGTFHLEVNSHIPSESRF